MDDLKSILAERSHCPSCRQKLKWIDLIPFLSFLMLRAKCRYCKAPISWQYPIVELVAGLMFAFLYSMIGLNLALAFFIVLFSILLVVLVYDARTQNTPEFFVWMALGLAFVGSWYFSAIGIGSMLLGGIVAGGFLALLVVFSKERWMGAGDIKLGFILGLVLGYPSAILGLFVAFLLGSIVGLLAIAFKLKSIKESLPFAPFLIIATFFTLFYGGLILNWYYTNFYY